MLVKCPSYHKYKLFEDFGYEMCQFGHTDHVIRLLNQNECSQTDKEKIVSRVYRKNEGKRNLEFYKICMAFRSKGEGHPMAGLTNGMIREIAKYLT